ncbi:MAG TPA: hypothetical protein IAB32_00385 [Candidatus Scatosoma pullicola]|nr:hypothetical protein [Candidatus Scatosoma pullicola]
MTQTELNLTANYIATLASQPDSKERIALFLDGLLSSFAQKNEPVREEKPSVSAKIRFSQKELTHMSKTFKKEFIANGLAAHVIKRQRSKNCTIYIIRYRRSGYNICVSANSMEEARARFLQATKAENIEKYRRKNYAARGTFAAIAREWLEFKEGKLNPRTHKNYESYCRRFLLPALGDMPVSSVKTIDLNKIMSGVEGRVYEDLRIVLNSVFKYAMASGIISHNPVTLIPFKKTERSNRRALTPDEIRKLLKRLELPEFKAYKRTFLILLFFGLRPCELADARFEGDFLVARNAKRKNGKIEYKKIPVCPQAKEMLDLSAPVECPHITNSLNRIFKRIMEDEAITQYYLRHTFATVCQQYVRPDIVDVWMGDSSERLVGKVYTHFPDKFLYEQMQKVTFDY